MRSAYLLDINSQTFTLLHVVKSLGEYLTNDDGNIREKGMILVPLSYGRKSRTLTIQQRSLGVKLLSTILAQCQPEQITKQSSELYSVLSLTLFR